jgi:hypothetical protein
VPGVGTAARAALLQVTQTFACKKKKKELHQPRDARSTAVAVQPSCLCFYPRLGEGTAHLPGMQYLTGGAMTAVVPDENKANFSLVTSRRSSPVRNASIGTFVM